MLGEAIAGMDEALLQTVEAHRRAIQNLVDQGVSLQERQLKRALSNLERLETSFFSTISRSVSQTCDFPLRGLWAAALNAAHSQGSLSGARAAVVVHELSQQPQTLIRIGQVNNALIGRAMLNAYGALASGILIGMCAGLLPTPRTC